MAGEKARSPSGKDHEGTGADEWDVPGYGGKVPSRPPEAGSKTVPTQAAKTTVIAERPRQKENHGTRPSATQTVPPSVRAPTATNSSRTTNSSRGTSSSRGRSNYRALGGRRGYIATRSRPNNTTPQSPPVLFNDSPAKSKWRNGGAPTAIMKLPVHFGVLKREVFGIARTASSGKLPGRGEVFEDICRKTGAYIKPPAYTDLALHIWGELNQVEAAKTLLEGLIQRCQVSSYKKKVEWARINAHSTVKEADIDMKERQENLLLRLRKAPDPTTMFLEKLLFLWPTDGPSMKDCLGQELQALDNIRARYGYHVFIPSGLPNCICVLGHEQDIIRQIVHRIRAKWSEIIVKNNVTSKTYVAEPPQGGPFQQKLVIQAPGRVIKSSIQGDMKAPIIYDLDDWRSKAASIQSKNKSRILSTLERSLQGLKYVRGHLRMRVNFGSFVFDKYRVPQQDMCGYSFEEFWEMIAIEQTKGRLIPGLVPSQQELLRRCFNATHLFDPLETTSKSLESAEPAYSVNFEFLGSNNALLRLEAEFAKRPGAQDYEITQRRWVRPRNKVQTESEKTPLQVATVDFDRSDWQIEIKSLEFHETSSIDTALKVFSHSIGFRRAATEGGIAAKSQRKVIFPVDAPVSRFVEKTALQYRLKGTNYTFELARYDEYSRKNTVTARGAELTGPMSDVPSTSWGASIFGPHWDNLLGQHANMPVGYIAGWNPKISTFFPSKEHSNQSEENNSGFWECIDLIKQVAQLLGPSRQSSTKQVQDTETPKEGQTEVMEKATVHKYNASTTASTISEKSDEQKPAVLLDVDLGTLF
ncbi:hypothetical protein ASPZODRAFT_89103 [Penicilliopsis zonata CBS 506.65]|uniref:DUF7905 domain-containing protein n=1 Tax=Penicilliopsis zonata CBS 506.65 TaxID=1073090 RepID=A0A1L9SRG7_9EURO|nr:hypothetical protein ASPZODRAFT_89103 [Penicilliopsis zonata CBS 506.65]OJJ49706.1 hypothetical protein ASPZODRAFT_89103 [Penicilliopsis zonata CBS 506.65]